MVVYGSNRLCVCVCVCCRYVRPERLFNRLTTVKALAEVHQRLADLMFPTDKSLIQTASRDHENVRSRAVRATVSDGAARHGKRATGDEEEYKIMRNMRSV